MANQVLVPPPKNRAPYNDAYVPHFTIRETEVSVWRSLFSNIRDLLFPEKLPPLRLTSKPVQVGNIWVGYGNRRRAATVSIITHIFMVAGLIAVSVIGARMTKAVIEDPKNSVTLVAPQLDDYMPQLPMTQQQNQQSLAGGGGGGDRSKIEAPKGRLPKRAFEQFTPPVAEIRNDDPKLPMEPTVVVPPDVKIPDAANMPNLGDPSSRVIGPPSNGTGSGGGIGSGSGGGVGAGTGPGVGKGQGGGYGGGVYKIGGGVTAPRAIETPDPEYSEEARKAKYQGVVVLWMIVDPNGQPRQVKVARGLGMGLDQKAIEAVQRWKFEPAKKDGQPVAVQINVEVNFRLY